MGTINQKTQNTTKLKTRKMSTTFTDNVAENMKKFRKILEKSKKASEGLKTVQTKIDDIQDKMSNVVDDSVNHFTLEWAKMGSQKRLMTINVVNKMKSLVQMKRKDSFNRR